MSSDAATLRLVRPLRAVRSSAGGPDAHPRAGVDELRNEVQALAEKAQVMSAREAELARREAECARKQAELERKVFDLAGLLDSVQRRRTEMLEMSEEDIVAFSLSLTEKVLQHELEGGHYRMGAIVRSALKSVKTKGAVTVRVHPRDLETTQAAIERLETSFGVSSIEALADESIAPASCSIETDHGRIVSDVEVRLERIKRNLVKHND